MIVSQTLTTILQAATLRHLATNFQFLWLDAAAFSLFEAQITWLRLYTWRSLVVATETPTT